MIFFCYYLLVSDSILFPFHNISDQTTAFIEFRIFIHTYSRSNGSNAIFRGSIYCKTFPGQTAAHKTQLHFQRWRGSKMQMLNRMFLVSLTVFAVCVLGLVIKTTGVSSISTFDVLKIAQEDKKNFKDPVGIITQNTIILIIKMLAPWPVHLEPNKSFCNGLDFLAAVHFRADDFSGRKLWRDTYGKLGNRVSEYLELVYWFIGLLPFHMISTVATRIRHSRRFFR